MRANDEPSLVARSSAHVALKPTAPGFKYATDRGLIAPEVPVAFYFATRIPLFSRYLVNQLSVIDSSRRSQQIELIQSAGDFRITSSFL